MKQIVGTRFLILFTVLCAISGFLLRIAYFNTGNANSQIVISLLFVAVIIIVSLFLTKQTDYNAVFRSSTPDFVLSVLGCVLIAIGGVMRLVNETGFSRVIGVLAIIGAVAIFLSGMLRMQGKEPKTFGYIAVLLFYIVKLFFDFRRWMVDPAILDYCYLLFSSISFMLATFYAACFCYNHGKRRLLVISSLCGIFFGFACLPDLTIMELLIYLGSILWMFCCSWQALRNVE